MSHPVSLNAHIKNITLQRWSFLFPASDLKKQNKKKALLHLFIKKICLLPFKKHSESKTGPEIDMLFSHSSTYYSNPTHILSFTLKTKQLQVENKRTTWNYK